MEPNRFVNDQVTDAVTQTNVKVVAESPAVAVTNLYQMAGIAAGHSIENAVTAQNFQNITAQAATTMGVMQIYSVDTVSDAIAISTMINNS